MEQNFALKVDDLDNVATIFATGIVDGSRSEEHTSELQSH